MKYNFVVLTCKFREQIWIHPCLIMRYLNACFNGTFLANKYVDLQIFGQISILEPRILHLFYILHNLNLKYVDRNCNRRSCDYITKRKRNILSIKVSLWWNWNILLICFIRVRALFLKKYLRKLCAFESIYRMAKLI